MWNLWFNFETFTNLMKLSPTRAFEYRDKCHNETKTVETAPIINDIVENEEIQTEEINITREELKDLLKNAWIEFKWNSKTDVLVNLAIENNLI